MWLPASGSLQTVVLFTPGKCAARWICLRARGHRGLLRVGGVAVGGPGQAEAARAACRPRYAVRNAPRRCSSGTSSRVISVQVVGRAGRAAAAPRSSPAPLPVQHQVGQLGGGAGEHERVADAARRRPARRGGPCGRAAAAASSSRNTTRSPSTCSGSSARPAAACSARISPRIAAASASSCGVTKHEVGRARDAAGRRPSGGPARLTSGWPCGGRGVIDGPAHREPLARRSRCSAACRGRRTGRWRRRGSRRRPPSCPTAGARPRRSRRPRRTARPAGRVVAPASRSSAATCGGRTARPRRAAADIRTRTPGPPGADVVERGDRLGRVERLGVRDDHGRARSPMCSVSGATRAATSTASSRPRTWSVRSSGRNGVRDCSAERVLDGDQVEQAALGLLHQLGPVARGEQLVRAGAGLAPGRPGASRCRPARRRGGGWVRGSACARCSSSAGGGWRSAGARSARRCRRRTRTARPAAAEKRPGSAATVPGRGAEAVQPAPAHEHAGAQCAATTWHLEPSRSGQHVHSNQRRRRAATVANGIGAVKHGTADGGNIGGAPRCPSGRPGRRRSRRCGDDWDDSDRDPARAGLAGLARAAGGGAAHAARLAQPDRAALARPGRRVLPRPPRPLARHRRRRRRADRRRRGSPSTTSRSTAPCAWSRRTACPACWWRRGSGASRSCAAPTSTPCACATRRPPPARPSPACPPSRSTRRGSSSGRFEPYPEPRRITVGAVVDGLSHFPTALGVLRFALGGAEQELVALTGKDDRPAAALPRRHLRHQHLRRRAHAIVDGRPTPDGRVPSTSTAPSTCPAPSPPTRPAPCRPRRTGSPSPSKPGSASPPDPPPSRTKLW